MRFKKHHIIFFFFVVIATLPKFAISAARKVVKASPEDLVYRKATLTDLPSIQKLYNEASEDDRQKLLLLPEPFQTDKLTAAIEGNRIFIAIDPEAPETRRYTKVVGIIKVFVVGSPIAEGFMSDDDEVPSDDDRAAHKEKMSILTTELRAIPAQTRRMRAPITPAIVGAYSYPYMLGYDQAINPVFKPDKRFKFSYNQNQTYIYVGSVFTAPRYRGQGIGTELERVALDELKDEVLADIIARKSKNLFCLYGVVMANANTKTHIRVFSAFSQSIKAALQIKIREEQPIFLRFFAFETYKPSPSVRRGRLSFGMDEEENKGYGCLIDCQLTGACYNLDLDDA